MKRRLVSLILCAGLSGCGGPQPIAPTSNASAETLGLLTDGLQLRRWIVRDDPTTIAQAMLAYGETEWLDEEDRQRLSHNGLRLVRVPAASLDSLHTGLHTLAQDLDAWYGQALRWRAIDRRDLGNRPRAVYIDGRPQRFERGSLEIVLRGWTLPMEFGPRFYLELIPRHVVQVEAPARIGGRARENITQPLPSMALSTLLETGYVYILVGESPQADWTALAAAASQGDETQDITPPKLSAGPPDPAGPVVSTPQTVGQLLLSTGGDRPVRELYLFVPKIPAERFPRGLEVATDQVESTDG